MRRLSQLLWVGAILYVVVLSSVGIIRRLAVPHPRTPWEAGQVVEGWRSATNQEVYEPAATGHATHMYGALTPAVNGVIYKATGPSVLVPRVLALITAFALTCLILACVSVRGSPFILFGFALLIGSDTLTGGYFSTAAPDYPAILLAVLGLVAAYKLRTAPVVAIIACTILVLIGFFFKQTAAMFALVPILAVLLTGRLGAAGIALSIVPVVAVFGTIAALSRAAPDVYHYMIAVPRSYDVSYAQVMTMLINLLRATPLLWLALALRAEWRWPLEEKEAWLVAAVLVTVPLSALSSAKIGGTVNSWIPAIFAMHAYTIFLVSRRPAPAPVMRALMAIALVVSAYDVHRNIGFAPIHEDRDRIEQQVATLQQRARLSAPEDPTLLLPTQTERSIYLEFDAAPRAGTWSPLPPCPAWRDILAAEYVVDVKNWWQDVFDSAPLQNAGYRVTFESDNYVILQKPADMQPLLASQCDSSTGG